MALFGRSKHNLEALVVDFLPFEQTLHIVVADADMNLQVLQFDPESTFPPTPLPLPIPTNTKLTHSPSNRPQKRRRVPPPTQIHLPHRPLPVHNAHVAVLA